MKFFVPHAVEGKDEELYEQLAKLAGRPVPSAAERIASIRWMHDGDEWTAVVGAQLRGTRTRMRTRQRKRVEVTTPLSDPATVLVIFPGSPWLVVTDAPPIGPSRSRWVNPFMAGVPTSSTRFEL